MRTRQLRIPLLFLLLTNVPLAAVAWLGWQFLQQDRDLDRQRQREHWQGASELLARELQTLLQAIEQRLAAKDAATSSVPPVNSTLFRVRAGQVIARSGVALPFYPVTARALDDHAALFASAERLEFDGRCDLAIGSYTKLTTSFQDEVRAAAFVRVARCLRKLRRGDEALDAYLKLGAFGSVAAAGMPAELLARGERSALLAKAGRTEAARAEEHLLRELLLTGRFPVDRGTFEFFADRLGIADREIVHLARALAAERWPPPPQRDTCARTAGEFAHVWLVGVSCRDANETVHVMLIPAADLLAPLRTSADSLQVAAAVIDVTGRNIWGAAAGPESGVDRQLSDLALPWQLQVRDADPARASATLARRRALAVSGLALMVAIVAAAAFFVLRAVNRELEIARLQADFISTVSHEFRTPLTAMRHLTHMLQEAAVVSERVPQYYDALQRETQRLQRLVEGLLDFRRFESGQRGYRMEPMDAQETVRQVLEIYAARVDSDRLQTSLTAADATIRGDREAIATAVSNLLENAFKYSPAHAPVVIEVEPRGKTVAISVQDRGPGIGRDERRRVFRKFVRGAAARDGHVKGTGIGLAIVQAVADAHGGRVDLHSVPGQGSRFTLLLPRA